MHKFGTMKRPMAWMLVSALTLSTVFNNGITAQAASANKVKSVTLKIGSKKVNKKTVSLEKGKNATIKVSVSPAKAKKSVSYKSSKKAIAKVSKKGKVTAVKAGTAKITVTVTGKDKKKKTAWVKIKVTEPQQTTTQQQVTTQQATTQKPAQQATTQKPATTAAPGTTEKQETTEKQGTSEQQETTAEDKQQATTAEGGEQATTAEGEQQATTAEGGEQATTVEGSEQATTAEGGEQATTAEGGEQAITTEQATTAVQDKYYDVGITGVNEAKTVSVNESVQLSVPVDEADKELVKWTVSDESIATISETGILTAKSAGTVEVFAKINDVEIGRLRLTTETTAVESVLINDSENGVSLALNVVGETTLEALISPINATDKGVEWTSADPLIAAVEPIEAEGKIAAKVTAKGEGTTTITVTTRDGQKTASVEVTVTKETRINSNGLTVEVTTPRLEDYSDAEKGIYSYLTGVKVVNVRVHLNKDGKAEAKKNVTLNMTPQFYFGEQDSVYLINGEKSTLTDKTDEDGVIDFSVSLTGNHLDAKPTDGNVQSFKLEAVSDGVSAASCTLRFGAIDIQKALVLNGKDAEDYADAKDKAELLAGLNAQKVNQSALETVKDESGDRVEYVVSQQTSAKNNKDEDHTVYFYAAPFIMMPPTVGEKQSGQYKVVFDENEYASGAYSIYNDENNTTTTKVIERVPAGLKNAVLKFKQIELSDFTCMDIRFYEILENGDREKIPDSTIHVYPDMTSALEIQIPANVISSEHDVFVEISLQSEGQVDSKKKGGYILSAINGEYESEPVTLPKFEYLSGYTKWEQDNDFGLSSSANGKNFELTAKQAEKYLPVDENADYVAAGNTYSYKVPSFPHVGNAIITVKGTSQTWYFTYPITSDLKNHTNDIAASSTRRKAVLIGTPKEAQVGELTPNEAGNVVAVNSYETGYTALVATVNIREMLGDLKFSDENDGVFRTYTYIQWANNAKVEKDIEATDFYALKGQEVEVVGTLLDTNGDPVAQSGNELQFLQSGKEIAVDELKKYITTEGFAAATDDKGQIRFSVKNTKDSMILQRLSAKSAQYDVEFNIKGTTAKVATIHWVDPGLYFKDQVDVDKEGTKNDVKGVEKESFTVNPDGFKTKFDMIEHAVGTEWIYGLKTIGKLPEEDSEAGYSVDRIDGINVNYKIRHEGNTGKIAEFTPNEEDGHSFTISNPVISPENEWDEVTGTINETSVADPSQVVFTIKKDDEIVGEYPNVGSGTKVQGLGAEIVIPIKWVANGSMVTEIGTANGMTTVDCDTALDLYVTVHDDTAVKNPVRNQEISYSILQGVGEIKEVSEQKITTNQYGVAVIPLAAPGSTGEVRISVTVGSEKKSFALTYNKASTKPFMLSDHDNNITYDTQNGEIKVKFNDYVDANSVKLGQFTLNSTKDGNIQLQSAAVSETETEKDVVVIKLANSSYLTNVTDFNLLQLQISDFEDVDGKVYTLYSTSGVPYKLEILKVTAYKEKGTVAVQFNHGINGDTVKAEEFKLTNGEDTVGIAKATPDGDTVTLELTEKDKVYLNGLEDVSALKLQVVPCTVKEKKVNEEGKQVEVDVPYTLTDRNGLTLLETDNSKTAE